MTSTLRRQDKRSAITIAALRTAAIEVLAEVGYVGTTTLKIAKRAGVTRGAVHHHYSDKLDLLIDATDAMWNASLGKTRALAAQHAVGAIDLETLVEELWSVSFSQTNVSVTIDMIITARNEPRLAEHLDATLVGKLFPAYAETAEILFASSDLTAGERQVAITMVTAMIRGLRMADMMQADPATIAAARPALVKILKGLLRSKASSRAAGTAMGAH